MTWGGFSWNWKLQRAEMKHRGKVGIMVPRPVFRSLMVLPSELRRGRAVGDHETMWQLGDSSCCLWVSRA